MEDEILAARILDVIPFRQLVQNYWKTYQWLYGTLMLVHIIYMIIYTIHVLPDSATIVGVYNTSNTQSCRSLPSSDLFGLFLIWPCLVLAFLVYYTLSTLFRCAKTRSSAVHGKDETCKCCWLPPGFRTGILNLPFRLLSALFGYLAQLSALAFSVTAVVWYALYRCGTTAGLYVEVVSVVFVIGWMFTLQFTKGFQTMHAFSIMLKYIVLRDITRFLVMYVFVLLGFGFAFHALFQLSPTIADPLGSPFNTLFTAFNMMLGMGDSPVDSGFDATYEASGGDPVFVKWVYILYVAISTIILLSLLIAMMTDTFTDIKSKEATTWQVGSLRLALRIERSMPFLRRALCCSGRDRVTYDGELGRWMMSTGVVGVGGGRAAAAAARSKEESIDELLKVVLRLDNKLDYLQNAYVDLSRQVDTVSDAVQGRDAANGVASRSRRPPGPASFYNIAKSMMTRGARPTSATGRNARSTKL